ncbi:MAG: radical SAM protein [Kiritimatiellia bacterium]
MLTVTRHCNLNCRYCYESHKGNDRRMSVETAKRVLTNEFEYASRDGVTEALDISFMGGEPLEEFDLIKEVSEWVWGKDWPLPYELSLPTNGTLLTDNMRKWFTANKHRFSVGLSFDGLSGVNEINRTSLPIDYEYFIKTWPDRRIAVVLFRDSIQYLVENVRQMNERRIPFTAVIGDGFEWTEEDARIYEEQMMELIPDYLGNPDEARASGLFSLRIANFFPGNRLKESAFCGAVDNIVNYDVDGTDYICHIFAPLTLGQELADRAKKEYANLKIVPWDPVCDACPIRNTCKPCFGFHVKLHGDVNKWSSPRTTCRMQKAKARMCSLYHLKRMEQKIEQGETLSGEELMTSDKALRYLSLEEVE